MRVITNRRYILSKFVKTYRKSHIIALFHSLNLNIFFLDKEIANVIISSFKTANFITRGLLRKYAESENRNLFYNLVNSCFLVPDDFDEMQMIQKKKCELRKKLAISRMFLIVTLACNLQCKYCIENDRRNYCDEPLYMSKRIAFQAIDLFCRLQEKRDSSRRLFIRFYGGEPLLNFAVIKESVSFIQHKKIIGDLPDNTEVILPSNGTLIDKDKIKFFKRFDVSIDLSIDGFQEIHNYYRFSKAMNDTYALAMVAYSNLIKAGVRTSVSCTLTPKALLYSEDLLNFFRERFDNKLSIRFNNLHFLPIHLNEHLYYRKEGEFVIKAFKLLYSNWKPGDRIWEMYKALRNKELIYALCGGVGRKIVVSPGGKVGACEVYSCSREYFSSSALYNDFNPRSDPKFIKWKNISPLNRSDCLDCGALGICGGGCPINAKFRHGSILKADDSQCYQSKLFLDWLIWDYYEKNRKNI